MRKADLEASFTEYVTARRPALVRTAYLLCGDEHAAEDLVQGALVRTWPRWSSIRRNDTGRRQACRSGPIHVLQHPPASLVLPRDRDHWV